MRQLPGDLQGALQRQRFLIEAFAQWSPAQFADEKIVPLIDASLVQMKQVRMQQHGQHSGRLQQLLRLRLIAAGGWAGQQHRYRFVGCQIGGAEEGGDSPGEQGWPQAVEVIDDSGRLLRHEHSPAFREIWSLHSMSLRGGDPSRLRDREEPRPPFQ